MVKPEIIPKIIVGNCLEVLKSLPEKRFSVCMTSPPYYGLRDYKVKSTNWNGWNGQLGREESPQLYVSHLCDVFDAVKRVLRDDGTCFVNIGDNYAGSGGAGGNWSEGAKANELKWKSNTTDQSEGSLFGIPSMFCDEMKRRGWIHRNTIIWHKRSARPDPCKTRFTNDYEPIYFFVKSNAPIFYANPKNSTISRDKPSIASGIENIDWKWITHKKCKGKGCDNCSGGKRKRSNWMTYKYYFQQLLTPLHEVSIKRWASKNGEIPKVTKFTEEKTAVDGFVNGSNRCGVGANKRTTWFVDDDYVRVPTKEFFKMVSLLHANGNMGEFWTVGTSKLKDAHFASYPIELCIPPISAGCPKKICDKCGLPTIDIYKADVTYYEKAYNEKWDKPEDERWAVGSGAGADYKLNTTNWFKSLLEDPIITSRCKCTCENPTYHPGEVLDPFAGSGSTLIAAYTLGVKSLGIDLNKSYAEIAQKRINGVIGRMKEL